MCRFKSSGLSVCVLSVCVGVGLYCVISVCVFVCVCEREIQREREREGIRRSSRRGREASSVVAWSRLWSFFCTSRQLALRSTDRQQERATHCT